MKAMVITRLADKQSLQLKEMPSLELQNYEVKIKTKAIGVNQADLLQINGKYPAPPGYPVDIPGLEFAGIVEATGNKVNSLQVGDRVFGLTGGGAYAEEIIIHCDCVSKIPEKFSFTEAAAIPEAFITAYDALITQMNLRMGECVLISAIGSGVGIAAVQIAKVIGAKVIGTSRTKEKLRKAQSFGLDYGVLVVEEGFAKQIREISKSGPDVILELVGGNYLVEDIDCIANQGRIIIVGLLAGRLANLDLGKILSKRLLIKGTTLRSRPLAEKIMVNQVLSKNIVPLLEAGNLRPVIDKVFHLFDAAEALEYMNEGNNFGKIVLTCD